MPLIFQSMSRLRRVARILVVPLPLLLRATPVRRVGVSVWAEGQSALYVESGNAGSGVVYFRTSAATAAPAGIVVPFTAVRGAILTHASVTWRTGLATWFASLENIGNARTASNLTINASNGRFYFPTPPRTLTAGCTLRFE